MPSQPPLAFGRKFSYSSRSYSSKPLPPLTHSPPPRVIFLHPLRLRGPFGPSLPTRRGACSFIGPHSHLRSLRFSGSSKVPTGLVRRPGVEVSGLRTKKGPRLWVTIKGCRYIVSQVLFFPLVVLYCITTAFVL
jgi:hypothetical protein